jgi:hypothetical protein
MTRRSHHKEGGNDKEDAMSAKNGVPTIEEQRKG